MERVPYFLLNRIYSKECQFQNSKARLSDNKVLHIIQVSKV